MKGVNRTCGYQRCHNPVYLIGSFTTNGICKQHYDKLERGSKLRWLRSTNPFGDSFLGKQREYQALLCLYEEADGRLPQRLQLRLEALSEYLGRDIEEWRMGKDKTRHLEMLGEAGWGIEAGTGIKAGEGIEGEENDDNLD